MTEPYWETERDLPVDVEGRTHQPKPATCLLCGFEGTPRTVWQKPAWWREAGPDGKRITTVPRCLDIEACRARVTANGEAWPLLERGENPWGDPTESAARARPDAAAKEVERVDWI